MDVGTLEVAALSGAGPPAAVAAGWDDLAVALGAPRSAPAPVLCWLRHLLPPRAGSRLLVATDAAGAVAGVLPLVVSRDGFGFVHYDLPGVGALFGVEPLARPADEPAVALALAASLEDLRPVPDTLAIGSMRTASAWPGALASALSRRYERAHAGSYTSSWIDLAGGLDGWLQRRDAGFRARLRRRGRRLAEDGFTCREWTAAGDVVARLPTLRRLYLAREHGRGGAGYRFDDRMAGFLVEIAGACRGTDRLRLVTVERAEAVAAAQLLLCAGGCASLWLTGFDGAASRYGPGIAAIVHALRSAAARGEATLDLGAGEEPYKGDLADGTTSWVWERWQRRGLFPVHTPAALVPRHARSRLRGLRAARPPAGQPENAAANAVRDSGSALEGSGLEP